MTPYSVVFAPEAEDQLEALLGEFAAIGTSEIHLIPTSSDLDQLRRVADVVADFDANRDTNPGATP